MEDKVPTHPSPDTHPFYPFPSDQEDVDSFRSPLSTGDYNYSLARSPVTNSYTYQYATAPIRLSAACRLVNSALTGPRASRSESVDRAAMERVWSALADSWEEFEGLRMMQPGPTGTPVPHEESDRFVSGWQVRVCPLRPRRSRGSTDLPSFLSQIFIFEACEHSPRPDKLFLTDISPLAVNVIREKLADRIARMRNPKIVAAGADGRLSPTLQTCLTDLIHLHDIAESKCHDMCRRVLDLIKRHLTTAFFDYDASLCRDGVYYAGERVAVSSSTASISHPPS